MDKLIWTEAMSVGVPELDEDHKGLISIINRLAQGAQSEMTRDDLRQCIFALMRYAQLHFAREEAVMSACSVIELPEHKQEHKEFAKIIRDVAKSFDEASPASTPKVNQELLTYLTNWLRHHILVIDMSYRPHVENQAIARQTAQNFKASHMWLQH